MDDYPKHPAVTKQPPCKPPPSSNHMVSEKGAFDGRTTQSIAYKAWPVSMPEKPKWAIKPEYKRPPAGISFNSTYMFDFRDPGKISRVEAITPSSGNDIIKHVDGEGDSGGNTTYQVSYPEWTGAMPAQTYHQKPVYVPPEKGMEFKSTQRSHFKGEPAERALLCRKTSEHRQIDKDKRMYFRTTYQDTFRDPRPRSCPATFTVSTPLQIRASPVQRSPCHPDPGPASSEKIDLK
ncbi:hypothetical protein FSP39_006524 [Pinctada imbricata]|uniref:Uncharacterized protein n=1 Tax=Pinctada imbricata TaxID=66713 RepID=A0AA88XZI6_PINIB|nr:hypothetical protein FSP39_006524 [Pinctada imbricata]